MSIAYNTNDKPLLFCHRGVHQDAPENSLPAFEKVLKLGLNAIETDLHLCKSGEIVIMHDTNLKRMTGVDKDIRSLTISQIKELDIGINSSTKYKGTKIPTLREVFELCSNNVLYDLELKNSNLYNRELAQKTWKLIREYKLEYNCLISSFNPILIKEFEKISHNALQTALIYSEGKEVPRALRHGWGKHLCNCTILKPEYTQIDDKLYEKISNTRYKLLPWCVDTITEAKQLMEFNPIGIITNHPEILNKSNLFY
jgi:glycerophosphoryl diester phosphodiesterase